MNYEQPRYQIDDGVGHQLMESIKSAALGSVSDTDSGCIQAGPPMSVETDAWSLMSMNKRVTLLTSSGSTKSHRLELLESQKQTEAGVKLVKDIAAGLDNGMSPEKTEEGFGGTYFMANATGQKLAIFKPCDEEPFAPCNPKGFIGRSLGDSGLKPTVRVGEAALREVAAYLLDHDSFAKIPTTLLIGASHPSFNYISNENPTGSTPPPAASSLVDPIGLDLPVKLGSIQEYVPHLCDTTEMGTSKFSVSDVQRIAIQDIRLYNTDRHAGNILVRKIPLASRARTNQQPQQHHHQFGETGYELVPIDHGFCLPEALEPPYFEWQHWSQARMPLGEKERDYIAKIDIEADKELLRSELPVLREESLRTMEVSTTLLKKCVVAGLSLNEIAEIMTRPLVGMDKEKSNLEKLCLEARDQIWSLSYSTSDSEDSETTHDSSSSNHSRTADELMFKLDNDDDDWKDLDLVPELDDLHSPFCSPNQLEECMEQLVLDDGGEGGDITSCRQYCYNDLEANQSLNGMRSIPPPPRPAQRSMSMALPSSSVCFQKRGGNYNQRRGSGRRHSNDTPKRNATRVAYPPLIHGSLPGSENRIFYHVSQEEWPLFMEILCRLIDDGLKTGKWVRSDFHKGSMSMNFGISCPRF